MKYKIWWNINFAANIDGERVDYGEDCDENGYYVFENMTCLLKSNFSKVGADI